MVEEKARQEYLGDAVYAQFNKHQGQLVLTVQYGYGPVETIYLDLEIWQSLKDFMKAQEVTQ